MRKRGKGNKDQIFYTNNEYLGSCFVLGHIKSFFYGSIILDPLLYTITIIYL